MLFFSFANKIKLANKKVFLIFNKFVQYYVVQKKPRLITSNNQEFNYK